MSIWDFPEVAEEAPNQPSSGSRFPDLGDTWQQGLLMSPQWEGDLVLGSDDNSNDMAEDEYEDWSYEDLGSRAAGRGKRLHQ